MHPLHRIASVVGTFAVSAFCLTTAAASPYAQTNLVSSVPGLAQITDADLKNPWGMSFSATSPFWISNQGTNTSTLYRVTNGVVSKVALTVAIPTTAAGPQGPTGQVQNGTTGFLVNGTPASFIFADLNGTISAWNNSAGTTAQIKAATTGAVYTGLAITNGAAGPRLYAANGAQNRVDVFDANFNPITTAGGFVNTDPALAGLVPFNVQTIGGSVYVTYAPPGRAAQISAGLGSGAVAIFDANGALVRTLITGGSLASPWGLTLAPAGFGGFGGDLLVGNFSFAVAEINAFDPSTGAFLGTVSGPTGQALINEGLWAIAFGNGVTGDANTLYFNAGINGEADGLFGSIRAIPEPAGTALLVVGIGAMLLRSRRRAPHPR